MLPAGWRTAKVLAQAVAPTAHTATSEQESSLTEATPMADPLSAPALRHPEAFGVRVIPGLCSEEGLGLRVEDS